jgi:uncharacterized paraquat-inducible protein A
LREALMIIALSALEIILLASAVVPVIAVGVLCWFFFRAARRHDARERARLDR